MASFRGDTRGVHITTMSYVNLGESATKNAPKMQSKEFQIAVFLLAPFKRSQSTTYSPSTELPTPPS